MVVCNPWIISHKTQMIEFISAFCRIDEFEEANSGMFSSPIFLIILFCFFFREFCVFLNFLEVSVVLPQQYFDSMNALIKYLADLFPELQKISTNQNNISKLQSLLKSIQRI